MTRSRPGVLRRYGPRLALAVGSLVVLPAATEGLLRLAWNNPYRLEEVGQVYVRLHRPGLRGTVSAERIYAGGGDVVVATDGERAIRSGADEDAVTAIALGGSTTESALVPQGQRWPDLVPGGARNFGVSGNSSVDSYWNLRFLADSLEPPVTTVYIDHAVNDLRAYLIAGADAFTLEAWRQEPVDLFSIDNPGQRVLFGLAVRDSWLLSLLRFTERELRGRRIFDAYLANHQVQAGLPELEETGFRKFRALLREDLLPARRRVYSRLAAFASEREIEVVMCTQPHAYRPDFRPFDTDLRLCPVVDGRRLTLEQSATVMDMINRQNASLAARHGWQLADAAARFAALDPSPLFYDAVHLTPEGSRLFADCVAEALEP